MEKRWIYKNQPDRGAISSLASALNLAPSLAILLLQRGIQNFSAAKAFFRPHLDNLPDPFLMKDLDKALDRLESAFTQKEKILIYGDYDVDGVSSVSLMYNFLRNYHDSLDYYIPDRHGEGYGLSEKAIHWAAGQGIKLLICLDCGIKAHTHIQLARELNIDTIICDHHLPDALLPPAYAILNPKQKDCPYPFKELSACGVGFKLLQGFVKKKALPEKSLYAFLDYLALSIALDFVEIRGENRLLCHFGLLKIEKKALPGLNSLKKVSGLGEKSPLSIRDLVYGIGPRLNAIGRLARADEAVDLLLCQDEQLAAKKAKRLDQVNQKRRQMDQQFSQEARDLIREKYQAPFSKACFVLYQKHWHPGLTGIIAARCVEKYHRPVFVFAPTEQEGILVGSARSVRDLNVYHALERCQAHLIKFGGHAQAAGLRITAGNLLHFERDLEKALQEQKPEDGSPRPEIEIDLELLLQEVDESFCRILRQFEPFGPGNMRPIFASKDVKFRNLKVLKGKHLSFLAYQEERGPSFRAIGFGMADEYEKLIDTNSLNLCYVLEENLYRGNKQWQLNLKDIHIS